MSTSLTDRVLHLGYFMVLTHVGNCLHCRHLIQMPFVQLNDGIQDGANLTSSRGRVLRTRTMSQLARRSVTDLQLQRHDHAEYPARSSDSTAAGLRASVGECSMACRCRPNPEVSSPQYNLARLGSSGCFTFLRSEDLLSHEAVLG